MFLHQRYMIWHIVLKRKPYDLIPRSCGRSFPETHTFDRSFKNPPFDDARSTRPVEASFAVLR